MKYAAIGPMAIHLPEKVEDNDFLGAQFPKWDMDLIYAKTGIRQRHIAGAGRVCLGSGRGGGRTAVCRAQHRPRHDRLSAVLHADARLSCCPPPPA